MTNLDTEGTQLTTADFQEADGSSDTGGMDYVDGAETPALVHEVTGSRFLQLYHGAQLKVDFNQTVNNNDRIGVAIKTPNMKSPRILDRSRARSYAELSFTEQGNSDKNDFTKVDLSSIEDRTVEYPEDSYVIITYDNADTGANSNDPSSWDVELDIREGNMDDLEKAMDQ